MLTKHWAKIQRLSSYRYFKPVSGLLIFAIAGTILLFVSKAATPFASLESETGTLAGNVGAVTDAAASGGSAVQFGVNSSELFLNGFFPIGVDVQPHYDDSFTKWKSRGINTLIRDCCGDVDPWANAADAAGLYQIRHPRSNPSADIGNPWLLAWAHQDEPDGISTQVPYEEIQRRYNEWKAIDPKRNVLINFVGAPCGNSLCQYDLRTGEAGLEWYKKYVAGADWISADTYPVNTGAPLTDIGKMVDALRLMAGNKPVFAYIESGDYWADNGVRHPTPGEFRAEVWSAIIHGVRGIWYFPVQVNPSFLWDITPADVAAEMTKQNATITQLAKILQGPINPTSINASVAAPLEVGWRSGSDGKYFFVLNLSSTQQNSRQITLGGTGQVSSATVFGENRTVPVSGSVITDNFAPYELHIYKVQ